MRKISDGFVFDLKEGFLSELTKRVQVDIDLDLFIRKDHINIYFKGSSILKLTERKKSGTYVVEIHQKYLQDMQIGDLVDEESTLIFINSIPQLKDNILHRGKPSLEIEYEQLIIRANNNEKRNNSDYFMIDRQYSPGENRLIDLMGIYWPNPRRKNQTVIPVLLEIKFALNTDIQKVHQQLEGYYDLVEENAEEIARDLEYMLRTRLELGLFDQQKNRLEALKTLRIASSIEDYQFILALVDYNPRSTLLDLSKIKSLPFADQIKLLYGGFGMWESNLDTLEGHGK